MIKVIPKVIGAPEQIAEQVSVSIMTFDTCNPKTNTYYQVCTIEGKKILDGNKAVELDEPSSSVSDWLRDVENDVLSYLNLERAPEPK